MSLGEDLSRLMARLDAEGRPNINPLWAATKDLLALALNQKLIAYETARRMELERRPMPQARAQSAGLASKLCTQADLESAWASYWIGRLGTDFVYQRKLWECCYVLQALWERGALAADRHGLRIGFDAEALSGVMAAQGCYVTIADTQVSGEEAAGAPTPRLDAALRPGAIDRARFLERVAYRPVGGRGQLAPATACDFCWSIGEAGRQGSRAAGVDFLARTLDLVRPGGLAVHIVDFAYMDLDGTIDNWPAVLLARADIERLERRLAREGHRLERLDLELGRGFMDLFIDVPPYEHDLLETPIGNRLGTPSHLRLMVDGFATTSLGLVMRRAA